MKRSEAIKLIESKMKGHLYEPPASEWLAGEILNALERQGVLSLGVNKLNAEDEEQFPRSGAV